ncbi:hypothetical protein LCGC14_1574270, partial [marine sediment metagenome]
DGKRETVDNTNMIDGELNEISFLRPSQSSTFLDDEAGISIYTDMGQQLDLNQAKSGLKTIEKETSNYIVGSISLPNLPESDDVHIFVHKDGWIVVYYLKVEPLSKIIDWNSYSGGQLTKTKLQLGLDEMSNILFIIPSIVKYYHFQYPLADKSMLIIEVQNGGGTDSFNIKIPGDLIVFERSWTHRAGPNLLTYTGMLTFAQLNPDIFHTVEAYVYSTGTWGTYKHSKFIIDGITINHINAGQIGPIFSEVGIGIIYEEV